ncbi:MAG: reverse transcriptase family protein, partial [Flavobacteriaceae bacterium]|nr:reverse transcriptase family protein [Flavobacteriaceae bacterium]
MKKEILQSKRKSYFNFCESLKKETGPLQWKKIKWLTKSNKFSIPTLEYQNFKITKDIEKASILMMQYRKTSREYNNKFNRNHKIFIEREVNRKNRSQFFNERTRTSEKRTRTNKKTAKNILVQTQISPNNQKYSYDIMLTVKEIQRAVSNIKINAPGGDKINNWFLKNLPLDVLKILLFIFNKSYTEGEFPKVWKTADIIPIFKTGKDPKNPINYRPISLLSCLGKLMEKIIYNRLYWISEKCGFLSDEQCGFRQRKSTLEPLIRLTQDIHRGFSTKSSTYVVFLDISKAYDTVWKDGLRFKLYQKGVRGRLLLWISDYLANRKGRVKLNDCSSNLMNLECGVPQGSVLSTLLFILYIDDVRSEVKNCEISIFADDIAIWIVENDFKNA